MGLAHMPARRFPGAPDRASVAPALKRLHAASQAYHAMTAASGKADDLRVGVLDCLVREGGLYAEVGFGGRRTDEVVRVWKARGWDVALERDEFLLLLPGEATAALERATAPDSRNNDSPIGPETP
ncbi:MAG: hypothetical protein QME60_01525 [Verrucomicrobiota bacterium]|nr:hypothetical protein [Verrucomicrobiota bacterium]